MRNKVDGVYSGIGDVVYGVEDGGIGEIEEDERCGIGGEWGIKFFIYSMQYSVNVQTVYPP